MVPRERPRSYYGLPIVKRPSWTWEVPLYFFTGGTAGALAAVSILGRWTGEKRMGRRARRIALAGAMVSPALLISDLGRPSRFLNMLRVLRPTSPMSLGSWTLAGFGGALGMAEASELAGMPTVITGTLEGAAGILGPILANYTAVLLGDTANPTWRGGRHLLPFIFSGSSMAAASGALCLTARTDEGRAPGRMVVAGTLLEQAAFLAMESQMGELAEPYRQGDSGNLARAHRTASWLGAGLVLVGRRSRWAQRLGGAVTLGSSALLRQAIYRAGFQAAENPEYLVKSQRG